MRSAPVVVGIGEILWDVFPEGKKLGGAPLNFSHHCGQLGASAHPVSAVGTDADGSEIRQILASKNLPDAHIQIDTAYPTGRVNVTLQNGKPTYEILAEVAWDYIRFDQSLRNLAACADAVCFGSLAQRGPVSRATIPAFLEAMRPEALRIFDVNLRQNFYSKEILETSLRHANIFKLSDEELPTLAGFFDLTGQVSTQLQRLREIFDLRLVAFTRGGEGSLLVTANDTSDHPGFPAEVIDTVGAGDSFTATLCMGVLQNLPLAEINQRACQVAAFVCSQSGATPLSRLKSPICEAYPSFNHSVTWCARFGIRRLLHQRRFRHSIDATPTPTPLFCSEEQISKPPSQPHHLARDGCRHTSGHFHRRCQTNHRIMKTAHVLALAMSLSSGLLAAENLADQFHNPPVEARAGVYWWWVNAFVDKAGITNDLEQLKAKGVSSVLLVNSGQHQDAFRENGPAFLSPEWRELYRHALQEAARLGIAVDVNMAPGWNMGGKWITPEKASRWYLQSETAIKGPQRFSSKLSMPQPNDGYGIAPMCYGGRRSFKVPSDQMDYRDTAVVAFRTPEGGKPAERQNLGIKANRVGGDCSMHADSVNQPPLVPWVSSPDDRPLKTSDVVDLTSKLKPDGTLEWDVPEGDWTVVRTGHRITNAPLSVPMPGFQGLENDFLDRAGIDLVYDSVGTELVKEAGPHAGKTLRSFATDSFEAGYPNWTANMVERFKKYRSYDPTPYLPVMKGWIVDSAEISDRFLHDYRKTVADCFADEHYGRMTELARKSGMMTRAEAAGPSQSGTVCTDALKNLGRVDFPQGEFWRYGTFVQGDQNMVCKQTASAAHIYGKKYAATESFTAVHKWRNWDESPDILKPLADRAFCEGINQIFFHSSTCQPADYGKPGIVYNAGTHMNPRLTWWEQAGGPWISYINRCHLLLQSGLFAADVLYYIGDGAPNLIPPKHIPAGLGKGYDYDACNEEVLLTRLTVKDGKIVLPDGMSYRVLVLPETTKMPVPVAQKLRELVQAGATVIGLKPLTDPGLKDYPQCDDEVKKIGDELWGGNTSKGRVYPDKTEREVLLTGGIQPDFEAAGAKDSFIDFIHRTTPEAEIYFLANRKDRPEKVTATFRQTGRQPELWNPMSGDQRDLPNFQIENGRTSIPLEFDSNGSLFVVFRKPTTVTAGEGSNFSAFETVQTLEGAWTVQFDKEWFYPTDGLQGDAANGKLVFDKLEDWTKCPEDAVKHFSGTATYQKTFQVSGLKFPVSKAFLALGMVGHSAKVRLNGKDLGVVWCNPRRVDITDALKSGDNELEIEVVNSWPNRLIGDAKLPKEQRRTRTNITQYEKPENQTLVPSGLLGPVTLQITQNH